MSSGWVYCHAYCFGCGKFMSFNPRRVPSIRPKPDMPPEPVCQDCIARVNPTRIANGLEPIVPFDDAYDPLPEHEL